jgi:hypothetical protein
MTNSKLLFDISSSARFNVCIAGVCNTKSTIHPKVITFAMAPLSTIFLPSPAMVMVSVAQNVFSF